MHLLLEIRRTHPNRTKLAAILKTHPKFNQLNQTPQNQENSTKLREILPNPPEIQPTQPNDLPIPAAELRIIPGLLKSQPGLFL
jgi:hypothetical protein